MATKTGWNQSGVITLVASATIDQYEQVYITGNNTGAPAGSGQAAIGVALTAATATGRVVDVRLYNAGGTVPGITAASVVAGNPIYAFTGGLLKATTTAASGRHVRLGVCVSGSTSTGSRIEWAPGVSAATT